MKGCIFNIDGGYLEALCRGFKCGILKQSDYLNLVQCESLEGASDTLTIYCYSLPFALYFQYWSVNKASYSVSH